MREERAKELDKLLQVVSFKTLQDFVTISNVMKEEGVSIGELKEYIDIFPVRRVEISAELEIKRGIDAEDTQKVITLYPACPDCGTQLVYQPVGSCPGNRSKKWKGRWLCPKGWELDNPEAYCGFEFLTSLDSEEMSEKYLSKGKSVALVK